MREPKLLKVADVAIAEIEIGDRKRPVSAAGVASISQSIRETGVMKDEIIVRKVRHQGDKLRLIAGGHRLEAARSMGWETIPAKIYDCSDDWAELMEIDDNLSSVDLSALELSVFLADRKKVHLRAFPESARGGDRKSADFRENQTDTVSFCSTIAEKRGMSERNVRRYVEIGEHLTPDAARILAGSSIGFKDLMALSKISAERQTEVASVYIGSKAKSIEEVDRAARGEPPKLKPAPEDGHYLKMMDAFDRAPMAARRRFLNQLWNEHRDLMASEAEAAGWEGGA